jgi:TRAP-type C4-dicarboxylate transport system permease small subunit
METLEKREPQLLRWLRPTISVINGAAMAVSALGILAALGLIGWSVLMRYALNQPVPWVDEVVGFLLVAIVTLAAADVLRKGQHIGVDILVGALRGRAHRLATLWSALMATAAALIWVVNGWEVAMFNRMLGIVTEGHLEWPVYWLMLFLPLGGALMLLTALEAVLLTALGYALPDQGHGHGQIPGEDE